MYSLIYGLSCLRAGWKLCVFSDIVIQNYSDQPLVPLEHAPVLYHLCQASKTDLTQSRFVTDGLKNRLSVANLLEANA